MAREKDQAPRLRQRVLLQNQLLVLRNDHRNLHHAKALEGVLFMEEERPSLFILERLQIHRTIILRHFPEIPRSSRHSVLLAPRKVQSLRLERTRPQVQVMQHLRNHKCRNIRLLGSQNVPILHRHKEVPKLHRHSAAQTRTLQAPLLRLPSLHMVTYLLLLQNLRQKLQTFQPVRPSTKRLMRNLHRDQQAQ